jgi:periplasmic copper chaperone A
MLHRNIWQVYSGEIMKRILFAGMLAMLVVAQANADEVKVSKAWVLATAPGQDSASVQLTITSKKAATLIGVASGSAQSAEIHSMVMEGDVMKMQALEELPLPAKTPVTLGAEGIHLMLFGLRNPLKAGHKLPFALTVKFADGKTDIIRALAVIKPLQTTSSEGNAHQHH